METSAIIMMLFGLVVVVGGLATCITIAIVKDKSKGK